MKKEIIDGFSLRLKEEKFLKKLKNIIFNARELSGMSQMDLAKKIGTSQRVISNIENGLYMPGAFFLSRIAKVLNIIISVGDNSISAVKIENARTKHG